MTDFKQRFINYLICKGLTETAALRLYLKGSGEYDLNYSPEWYAQEQLNCDEK